MPDSWLDRLPSQERQRIRERLRSPAEYEKLREKVKGPEDLEREMERSALLAELRFAMESEPKLAEALRAQVQEDVQQHGLDSVLQTLRLSEDLKGALEKGDFTLSVQPDALTHVDQLVLVPEGKIAEALPVSQKFSEQYLGQFKKAA
ncbi:MAG TPA: hypothetical protein DEB30_00780 [Candidatus Peribacter riflensis]|uniref:Uncharacterized protein n=1 Tax=Candidatus Peribacter riflensis TaxID=1735162 RepID=A0A0S1SRN2_9BACT|nr:MAG: hypothetical protein PeribacterA2_0268 [Candidatus Peribacter riflensis]OGJ78239.1 MAG: hypothetical protein A2398_05095 [Candidatus Peribacteria bacterium RIFOXYB1_FULL_57_12]OGJ82990.1 MAG: hypothetical protein A2412_05215 [Candidatus Peribacteria bacterium RIFOXYC1_FULL_58_8]ALM10762.1 MAG: hypothetical protein PeribacterB2_0268 [Candidatus Peribacter riflensis]ALM11864.1 MAG: hypothetical protein PeribacterC2_0267 [Candidatus Peribacter riflensis]